MGAHAKRVDDRQGGVATAPIHPLRVSGPSKPKAKFFASVVLPAGLTLANQEPDLPSITRVGNIRPDGSIIPSVRFAEYWHHDGEFWAPGQNFIVNFLSSVRVPAVGGNTGLLDSRLGYEKLDLSQKAELEGAYICVRASKISDFKRAAPHEIPPDVWHPVVLPHPITRQTALYLPDSSTDIQKRDGQA